MHGKNLPSQWISEIDSLGTRVVAGLWSLLLMTTRAWAQSSASSPFSPLQPAWGPQEFSSTESGGDEDEHHACQGPHTHPAHWSGRSRCSCPQCWCRCCSLGTPLPGHTHRYLPGQCTMAPGQTPRLGSPWPWGEPLSPEQCCPSPVRPAGQGPQPLKG